MQEPAPQEVIWEDVPDHFILDVGAVAYVRYDLTEQVLELQIDPVWDQDPIAVRIRAVKAFNCSIWSDTIGPILPDTNQLLVLMISRVKLSELAGFESKLSRIRYPEDNVSVILSLTKLKSNYAFRIQLYSDVTIDCLALDASLARVPLGPIEHG